MLKLSNQVSIPKNFVTQRSLLYCTIGILTFGFLSTGFAEVQSKVKDQTSVLVAKLQSKPKVASRRQKTSQKWTVTLFNKLSVKQKIRVYNSLITTMAVLEIGGQSRPSSAHFLRLLINRAYAQNGSTCFFAGYPAPCNNPNSIYSNNQCSVQGRPGVKCNTDLFPTAPCVHRLAYGQRGRIRGYATTQACAYAEAIRMKAYLQQTDLNDITEDSIKRWGEENSSDDAVDQIMNDSSLWGYPLDAWKEKTDALRYQDDDGKSDAYFQAFTDDEGTNSIVQTLNDVQETCGGVRKTFERKHCDFFTNDLQDIREAVNNVTPVEATDDRGAEVIKEECKPFSQLPGEHFCQAKLSDNKYIVVRFETPINEITTGDGNVIGTDTNPSTPKNSCHVRIK